MGGGGPLEEERGGGDGGNKIGLKASGKQPEKRRADAKEEDAKVHLGSSRLSR